MKTKLIPLTVAAISLCFTGSVDAQFISTLGQGSGSGLDIQYTYTGDWMTSSQQWLALPFSTDAQTYTLTSVQASIHHDTSSGTAPMVALLYVGDGNKRPTDEGIAGFTYDPDTVPEAPNYGTTFGTVAFTPTWVATLEPSTNYVFILFVAAGGPDSGKYEWERTAGDDFTGPSGGSWLMPDESLGAVFLGDYVYGMNNVPWSSVAGRFVAAINATAIPEPSTCAALTGLIALAVRSLAPPTTTMIQPRKRSSQKVTKETKASLTPGCPHQCEA